jgi:peptidoglycan/LPS O-acetylase OafA/YrhL
MTWCGLVGVLVAAFVFNSTTPYPGWAVVLPVASTALVIAGGMARPALGAETLLRSPPLQWMGRLSYSLYLWHWPILIIAAQHVGHTLSVEENLLWLLVALALSIVSYLIIENPIRHWIFLSRSAGRSLALGATLVCVTLGIIAFAIATHP